MKKERLGDYSRIKTGKLDANASNQNGLYPFFTCSKDTLRINEYAYDCECVLVAGNGDLNVKYYEGKFNAYQRTYIVESQNKDILDTKYMYYLINSKIEQLRKASIGGVIKYIKLNNLTDLVFEKIELEKQLAIVKRLDIIQDIIEEKKKQLFHLEELIEAQFFKMFGTLQNNNWEKERLENLALKITDGKHGGCKKEENSGYYFVGATEIYDDKINYKEANQIAKEDFEKDYLRCNLMLDDFVIVNTGATIGKSAIVENDVCDRILLQKSVALIRTKKEKIMPIYLKYCYKNNPSLYSKGQGCARINLLLKQIRNTIIPVPPLALQKQFAEIVNQIQEQKFNIKKSLNEVEDFNETLMNKYF